MYRNKSYVIPCRLEIYLFGPYLSGQPGLFFHNPYRFLASYSLLLCLLLSSCDESTTTTSRQGTTLRNTSTQLVRQGTSLTLLRNGKPYFIKGVCGQNHLDRLHQCGGNSIRIWDDSDADFILSQAQQLDLTVMLGLWVEREVDGFDYYDQKKIDQQFQRIRKTVLKYRHHPALLMWCVGNEWTLNASNIRVFDEVNRLAAMIHQLDPAHPVATAIMQTTARPIWIIRERCPNVDVLALNAYGALHLTNQLLTDSGWTKPYVLSEYGSKGHWESDLTPWRTSIEPNSQEKFTFVRVNYQRYIASRPPNCLGAYLFLWGNKEEGTHTWYNCFDEQGRETSLVNLMHWLWTGNLLANQAPVIDRVLINDQPTSGVSFPQNQPVHRARVIVHDPDTDSLTYAWEIRPDLSTVYTPGSTSFPTPTSGLIVAETSPAIRFTLPSPKRELPAIH